MSDLRAILGVLALLTTTSAAHAQIACVQQGLDQLGFEPGPVDGEFGRRTAAAAIAFADEFGIALPDLNDETSPQWCDAVTEIAKSQLGLARRFDVTSPPSGVLSPRDTEAQWNAYKTAPECFEHPSFAEGTGFPLTILRPEVVGSLQWRSPFTQAISAPACSIAPVDFGRPPAPIPVVTLDEAYGERQIEVEIAAEWFMKAATYVRFSGDPVARDALRQTLVSWAEADSLGEGINVSWGDRPVDYQMITTITALMATAAEVIPDLSPEDKTVVGPWLNRLAAAVTNSHWSDRQDNKAYLKTYVGLIWGLMVGDDEPVREAIRVYKLAIHDMRPDGSMPIDSQRGGMGISYNAGAVSHLVLIAAALRTHHGVDLFDYSVDGRSIHDAVAFVHRSIVDPSSTNQLYAIACPEGGDRWGSIERPSMGFMDELGYLLVYADLFPEREISADLHERLSNHLRRAGISDRAGGAAACQFAAPTAAVFEGTSITIQNVVLDLGEPKFEVFAHEDFGHTQGEASRINTLISAQILDAPSGEDQLDFNIRASYSAQTDELRNLALTINPPLGRERPNDLLGCAAAATRTYDDGEYRVDIRFEQDGNRFLAPDVQCVLDNLPEPSRFMAAFLTSNFRDVAVGMVNKGTINTVSHTGLRQWLLNVAEGRIIVSGN